ncbi:Helix-turn-helix domain-containing protein [Streptomyces sp. Termitarium-T10T-6]|nr:Helix-turn-helix domain-containing protein [Streptomyces sp. Termitarium-T10T-6]
MRMRARSGPTVEHRVLAVRLRMLRERAGVSLRAAAEALDAHPATVRRIERAETGLDARQVGELLRCYGVPPAVAGPIMAGLAAANLPGWWHRWRDTMEAWQQEVIGVESSASLVRTWHPALVPELLPHPRVRRRAVPHAVPRGQPRPPGTPGRAAARAPPPAVRARGRPVGPVPGGRPPHAGR